jgi:hypothetical protein
MKRTQVSTGMTCNRPHGTERGAVPKGFSPYGLEGTALLSLASGSLKALIRNSCYLLGVPFGLQPYVPETAKLVSAMKGSSNRGIESRARGKPAERINRIMAPRMPARGLFLGTSFEPIR